MQYYKERKHTEREKIIRNCGFCKEKAMAPHSSTLAWKIP